VSGSRADDLRSKILERWIAPYTATAVARLLEAGAVPIGKANCDEFAMGSSCENSALGVTRNPYDLLASPADPAAARRGGRRRRSGDWIGERHRRFDSRAGRVLQLGGIQTDYGEFHAMA